VREFTTEATDYVKGYKALNWLLECVGDALIDDPPAARAATLPDDASSSSQPPPPLRDPMRRCVPQFGIHCARSTPCCCAHKCSHACIRLLE
jgi:hypothetical protein